MSKTHHPTPKHTLPPLDSPSNMLIYKNGQGSIDVRLAGDTVWLTQQQLAMLFATTPDNVSLHLKNIYAEGELEARATTEDFSAVRQEGARQVTRRLKHYNLDAAISLGYRVNSATATRFRQWATALLKEHLTRGYTLHNERFAANAAALDAALQLIRKTAHTQEISADMGKGLVEIISRYTHTFLLLQRYDEGLLSSPPAQVGGILPDVDEARTALNRLKQELIQRGEATALFAQERENGLSALLGNLDQSVGGEPAYPSIEAKAAHLLYFIVKNHPFIDGNKRSAAYLFLDFLQRNCRLFTNQGHVVINDMGLTALTLLVAESAPTQKEVMINLIMNMLALPLPQ